jgi:RNA polymerase sigma factor (sigma-70 family)
MHQTLPRSLTAGFWLPSCVGVFMLNGVEPPEIDIQKLIDGDNAAWRAALPYFEPAAFSITRKRLGHCCPQFVEDVVMVAIEKLAWRLPRLPSPVGNMQNVRALLARITDNAAVDFFRKKCVRETPLVSDEEDGAEPSDPPDERDLEQLMRDWIDAKLIGEIAFGDLLTDKEKDVFKGIYLEGLKHREIEEKYGVPVKSVGNTNNHLLAKIRKYLDELESGM